MDQEQLPKDNIAKREGRLLTLTMLSLLTTVLGILAAFIVIFLIQNPQAFTKKNAQEEMLVKTEVEDMDLVEDGKDVVTGFIAQGDYKLVKTNCTACHSSKLVLQNRATREGWKEMIIWMQETQKLWDLGENEDKILDYLATYLGPEKKGRRAPLEVDEWYVID